MNAKIFRRRRLNLSGLSWRLASIRRWGRPLISLALAISLFLAAVLPVLGLPPFVKYVGELDFGGQRFISDSWVIREGSTYRMWYTHLRTDVTPSTLAGVLSGLDLNAILTAMKNQDLDALLTHLGALDSTEIYDLLQDTATVIGYATSSDGMNWQIQHPQVLEAGTALQSVATPCVIEVGGTYHMWYTRNTTDLTAEAIEQLLLDLNGDDTQRRDAVITLIENGETVINHATSPDGVVWTVQPGEALVGADVFLGDSVGAPNVINKDGGYEMWFSDLSTAVTEQTITDLLADAGSFTAADLWQLQANVTAGIGYATSDDGISWTLENRNVMGGAGALNAVATPCVIYDATELQYRMWYSYGVSDLTEADIAPIIDELSLIDFNGLLALFEAENYQALIDELTLIIDSQIPETKSRLTGTTTLIGSAISTDGQIWAVEESPVLSGAAMTPWSSVGRPCVVETDGSYEMWFTKGIDELTAQNLVDLWQGNISTIGYASSSPLIAETTSAVIVDGDGVVVINQTIIRMKDSSTGETVALDIDGYDARISADPAGVELLTVRGVVPFDTPVLILAETRFYRYDIAAPVQPDDTVTARVVLRLVGDCLTPYVVALSYDSIYPAAAGPFISEEARSEFTFLRGDATGDGVVNGIDSLAIAQYRVGLLTMADLDALNAASVVHDGVIGDVVNGLDALAIAQYRVGLLDEFFNAK